VPDHLPAEQLEIPRRPLKILTRNTSSLIHKPGLSTRRKLGVCGRLAKNELASSKMHPGVLKTPSLRSRELQMPWRRNLVNMEELCKPVLANLCPLNYSQIFGYVSCVD